MSSRIPNNLVRKALLASDNLRDSGINTGANRTKQVNANLSRAAAIAARRAEFKTAPVNAVSTSQKAREA